MTTRPAITSPILLLLLCLAGCERSSSETSQQTAPPLTPAVASLMPDDTDEYCGDPSLDTQSRTATTGSGDFTIELRSLPQSIPSNELFSFEVMVAAHPDIPTDQLSIIVDAGMPQHAHGMTVRPRATFDASNGTFQVEGMMFHMPGTWDLTVDVVDGPYTERVTFHVEAR